MSDTIDINVNKIVETIDVFANFEHPNVEINTIEIVDNVEINATPNVVQININSISGDVEWGEIEGILSNQTDLQNALDLKANASELGDVAFSNDYNDLDNLPTIPNNLEELHNVTETNYTTPIDADSVLTFDVNNSLWKRLSWANIKSNLKTYFDTIYQTALGFTPENVANKANDLTSPDNTKYPTTLAVSTALNGKQDTLTNPITGTGTINILPKFTGATLLGNSQIFDNGTSVGINTTTPNANNRLEVNGRTFISAGTDGTTTAPLIVRNTIPYSGSYNQFLQFWQNSAGSNIMSLRADGGLVVSGTTQANTLRLVGADTNTTNEVMLSRNGQNGTGLSFLSGHQIAFTSNSIERIRLDNNGNFVIGATTAGARLDVRAQGALSTDIAFRVRNSADTGNLFSVNGSGGAIFQSSTEGLTIQTTSNIGGLTQLLLHQSSANGQGSQLGFLIGTNTFQYAYMRSRFGLSSGFGRLEFGTRSSGETTTKMTLDEFGCLILGTSGVIGNYSAVLDLVSTTRGFLPPRMTTAQRDAITTPAAGLIVYDTTENKHYGFNGTTWNAFY